MGHRTLKVRIIVLLFFNFMGFGQNSGKIFHWGWTFSKTVGHPFHPPYQPILSPSLGLAPLISEFPEKDLLLMLYVYYRPQTKFGAR